MENIAKISSAFVKAQSEFGSALKTSTNPHFKSRYADLAACVEAVIDALNNNKIALIQKTHECESGVSVETIFLHESGEELRSGKLWLPASKQDAQGYGSALTYARRYSLMAACGIAPEDDDGNAASKTIAKHKNSALTDKAYADHMAAMDASTDMDTLKSAFANAYKAAKAANDDAALKTFTTVYEAKKDSYE